MNKSHKSKVTLIFKELSEKYGYEFHLMAHEPDAGYILTNDVRHYFSYGTVDLNNSSAVEFAQNKVLSSKIVEKVGICLPHESFVRFSKDLVADIKCAVESVGLPAIIKPVHGAQGKNIFKIESKDEIYSICNKNTFDEDDLIVQEYIDVLDEIRIVLLDSEIIQAYKRDYAHLVGDGIKTIQELIKDKNNYFKNRNRNTRISINDSQIQNILKNKVFDLTSILPFGNRLNLSYGRNLSKGGDYEFVENRLSPNLIDISKQIAKSTGLKLVGLDLFLSDKIECIKNKKQVTFIEYNASPDMENNFYYDDNYGEILKKIYEKVFLAIVDTTS